MVEVANELTTCLQHAVKEECLDMIRYLNLPHLTHHRPSSSCLSSFHLHFTSVIVTASMHILHTVPSSVLHTRALHCDASSVYVYCKQVLNILFAAQANEHRRVDFLFPTFVPTKQLVPVEKQFTYILQCRVYDRGVCKAYYWFRVIGDYRTTWHDQ